MARVYRETGFADTPMSFHDNACMAFPVDCAASGPLPGFFGLFGVGVRNSKDAS